MNTTIQDSIEREMVLRAPKERVYAAIADPKLIVNWFPQAVEGSFEPGSRPVFDFGEYGRFSIYVVAARPHEYFAYRGVGSEYCPQGFIGDVLTEPNTLVEFFLGDTPEGTRLRLVVSGFASLPAETAAQSIKDQDGGWSFMLDRLQKFVE